MDSKTQKSITRYMDISNQQYVEFPRQNSFEVYYQGFCLHSKLQTNSFPDENKIINTIRALIKKSKQSQDKSGIRSKPFLNDKFYFNQASPGRKISPRKNVIKFDDGRNLPIEIHQTLNVNSPPGSYNVYSNEDKINAFPPFIMNQSQLDEQKPNININIIRVNNNIIFTNKKLSPKAIKLYNQSPYRSGEKIQNIFQIIQGSKNIIQTNAINIVNQRPSSTSSSNRVSSPNRFMSPCQQRLSPLKGKLLDDYFKLKQMKVSKKDSVLQTQGQENIFSFQNNEQMTKPGSKSTATQERPKLKGFYMNRLKQQFQKQDHQPVKVKLQTNQQSLNQTQTFVLQENPQQNYQIENINIVRKKNDLESSQIQKKEASIIHQNESKRLLQSQTSLNEEQCSVGQQFLSSNPQFKSSQKIIAQIRESEGQIEKSKKEIVQKKSSILFSNYIDKLVENKIEDDYNQDSFEESGFIQQDFISQTKKKNETSNSQTLGQTLGQQSIDLDDENQSIQQIKFTKLDNQQVEEQKSLDNKAEVHEDVQENQLRAFSRQSSKGNDLRSSQIENNNFSEKQFELDEKQNSLVIQSKNEEKSFIEQQINESYNKQSSQINESIKDSIEKKEIQIEFSQQKVNEDIDTENNIENQIEKQSQKEEIIKEQLQNENDTQLIGSDQIINSVKINSQKYIGDRILENEQSDDKYQIENSIDRMLKQQQYQSISIDNLKNSESSMFTNDFGQTKEIFLQKKPIDQNENDEEKQLIKQISNQQKRNSLKKSPLRSPSQSPIQSPQQLLQKNNENYFFSQKEVKEQEKQSEEDKRKNSISISDAEVEDNFNENNMKQIFDQQSISCVQRERQSTLQTVEQRDFSSYQSNQKIIQSNLQFKFAKVSKRVKMLIIVQNYFIHQEQSKKLNEKKLQIKKSFQTVFRRVKMLLILLDYFIQETLVKKYILDIGQLTSKRIILKETFQKYQKTILMAVYCKNYFKNQIKQVKQKQQIKMRLKKAFKIILAGQWLRFHFKRQQNLTKILQKSIRFVKYGLYLQKKFKMKQTLIRSFKKAIRFVKYGLILQEQFMTRNEVKKNYLQILQKSNKKVLLRHILQLSFQKVYQGKILESYFKQLNVKKIQTKFTKFEMKNKKLNKAFQRVLMLIQLNRYFSTQAKPKAQSMGEIYQKDQIPEIKKKFSSLFKNPSDSKIVVKGDFKIQVFQKDGKRIIITKKKKSSGSPKNCDQLKQGIIPEIKVISASYTKINEVPQTDQPEEKSPIIEQEKPPEIQNNTEQIENDSAQKIIDQQIVQIDSQNINFEAKSNEDQVNNISIYSSLNNGENSSQNFEQKSDEEKVNSAKTSFKQQDRNKNQKMSNFHRIYTNEADYASIQQFSNDNEQQRSSFINKEEQIQSENENASNEKFTVQRIQIMKTIEKRGSEQNTAAPKISKYTLDKSKSSRRIGINQIEDLQTLQKFDRMNKLNEFKSRLDELKDDFVKSKQNSIDIDTMKKEFDIELEQTSQARLLSQLKENKSKRLKTISTINDNK